jgi:predicted aldo/keto reductase-like oxidoreductase
MGLTQQFGDIQVPVPGFGAMGISFGLGNNLTLEQAEPVLLKALELGCTFWDTAVGLHLPGLPQTVSADGLSRLSTKPA